jgi:hypothetical protein
MLNDNFLPISPLCFFPYGAVSKISYACKSYNVVNNYVLFTMGFPNFNIYF